MSGELPDRVPLVVIGAGPGGYAAAFHAADLGMNVALVTEEEKPGGVCLHRGCIPSKALLHVAKLVHEAEAARDWGIGFERPAIDLDQLRAWKEGVVDKLANGVAELCKARKVKRIQARVTFIDSHTLKLARPDGISESLEFEHAILATGSSPLRPGIFDIGDDRVMDSTGGLALRDIPDRLLVVGGGYIGLEMGTVYAALGSKVTVVEMTDGLLPGCDRDLVRPLQRRLKSTFGAIHLKTKVEGIEARPEGIVARLRGAVDEDALFDRVLVAVGRRPNSANLGLENTRINIDDKGFVTVDRQQRTSDPRVFAIGDVAGEPMLAHKASREAKVAVETIAGHKAEFDNVAIPAVVFTDPEIAWCGLTETQAAERNIEVSVTKFPWGASGRATTLDRPEGVTKLVIEPKTERVLGVGICGAGAGELIAEGTLAVEMAAVVHDLAGTIHPHPTLSETVMESAEAFFGHATHVFRPKKR